MNATNFFSSSKEIGGPIFAHPNKNKTRKVKNINFLIKITVPSFYVQITLNSYLIFDNYLPLKSTYYNFSYH